LNLTDGVGGRHGHCPTPSGGGGYLNNCDTFKVPEGADPRLLDLAEMRMPEVWLRVAEAVGVDAFLEIWRLLDESDVPQTDNGMLLLRMRRYQSWQRHERNRYIRALAQSGVPLADIQGRLRANLGETLSIDAIARVARCGPR